MFRGTAASRGWKISNPPIVHFARFLWAAAESFLRFLAAKKDLPTKLRFHAHLGIVNLNPFILHRRGVRKYITIYCVLRCLNVFLFGYIFRWVLHFLGNFYSCNFINFYFRMKIKLQLFNFSLTFIKNYNFNSIALNRSFFFAKFLIFLTFYFILTYLFSNYIFTLQGIKLLQCWKNNFGYKKYEKIVTCHENFKSIREF